MTYEELLREYLIQRNELNEVKKKYSKLVSYVCDFLCKEINIENKITPNFVANFEKWFQKVRKNELRSRQSNARIDILSSYGWNNHRKGIIMSRIKVGYVIGTILMVLALYLIHS